ncbi:MAG: amidohydrolase family protein [Capsulimonadaceae bacterium]|nr:amidohydrolase family protein [Capsulimonadaceae bacterium]
MDIIDINTLFGAYPSQRAESTPETLVDLLGRLGVGHALTLSTWGVYYHDMAGNQETLRATQPYSGQLIPAGTINPLTFWDSEEQVRFLVQTSFGVMRFFPSEQGWPIDFEPFYGILKLLSETPKPSLELAPGLPAATRGWPLWNDRGVAIMATIDKPGDATQLARAVADYPAPVIVVGTTALTLIEVLTVMNRCENLILETHCLTVPDGLARIRDAVGADRIVFGSGGAALSVRAALDYVRQSSLTDSEKAAVLGGNATSILLGGR